MDMKATRLGYGEGLVELGRMNKNVVVLDADLSKATMTNMFAKEFPERFFDIGIAEQNMLGIAGGLSLAGKIPFATTFGIFATGKAWEQVRTTVCYGELNVKIGGSHTGISVGPDGPTHQATEEIATMRVIPNMTVIVPCDAIQTKKATISAAEEIRGPVYIRFGREPVPIITDEKTPFIVGKAQVLKEGNDVTIFACGCMVYEAVLAADILSKDGINARVVNLHTVKPIDKDEILRSARETGAIVTAEEHQIAGGFGSAIAEVIVENCPVPMKMVGMRDRFGESGKAEELFRKFGLTKMEIVSAGIEVVRRKKG